MTNGREATVVVSSITHAIKGQNILTGQRGITAWIDRDLEAYGQYGCGYCIRIRGDCSRAVALLQERKVKIKEVLYQ